jgi:hypothetical protein
MAHDALGRSLSRILQEVLASYAEGTDDPVLYLFDVVEG